MKKKLELKDLKVQSFVTEIEKEQDVNGGAQSLDLQFCTRLSCGIVACTDINCTHNVLDCIH